MTLERWDQGRTGPTGCLGEPPVRGPGGGTQGESGDSPGSAEAERPVCPRRQEGVGQRAHRRDPELCRVAETARPKLGGEAAGPVLTQAGRGRACVGQTKHFTVLGTAGRARAGSCLSNVGAVSPGRSPAPTRDVLKPDPGEVDCTQETQLLPRIKLKNICRSKNVSHSQEAQVTARVTVKSAHLRSGRKELRDPPT